MLGCSFTFVIIPIFTATLGFGGLVAGAATSVMVLFFVFVVLFLHALIAVLVRGKGSPAKV